MGHFARSQQPSAVKVRAVPTRAALVAPAPALVGRRRLTVDDGEGAEMDQTMPILALRQPSVCQHRQRRPIESTAAEGWLGLGTQTMVNESDWLALVNRLKHNLYNERCVRPHRPCPTPAPTPTPSTRSRPGLYESPVNSSTRSCSKIATASRRAAHPPLRCLSPLLSAAKRSLKRERRVCGACAAWRPATQRRA